MAPRTENTPTTVHDTEKGKKSLDSTKISVISCGKIGRMRISEFNLSKGPSVNQGKYVPKRQYT